MNATLIERIRDAGYQNCPDHLEPGRITRFPGEGKGASNDAGYAILYDDGNGATVGDWSQGRQDQVFLDSGRPTDPAEARKRQHAARQAQLLLKAEEARKHRKAAQATAKAMAQAMPADHPYLDRKQIAAPLPVRRDQVMVAMHHDGQLVNCQAIDGDGNKRFVKGGRTKGAYHRIDGRTDQVVIVEGAATGYSVHAATGATVLCAMSAGNVPAVAEWAQRQYPDAAVILALDGDDAGRKAAKGLDIDAAFAPDGQDFNDIHVTEGLDAVRDAINRADGGYGIPPLAELRLSVEELEAASPTPPCIIENLLHCDLAMVAAPGAAGKTTLVLWEMIHIVLGMELWGREIITPGPCVFITAEDNRERLAARLNRLCEGLMLNHADKQKVVENLLIWDCTGQDTEVRLVAVEDRTFIASMVPNRIVRRFKAVKPVLITFDPTVSFGADESAVNVNDQALVTAARRIINGLGCAVQLIHHTSQASSREKMLDQYSSRGGTALPNGCRLVRIIQRWDKPGDMGRKPPAGIEPGADLTVMETAKYSYGPRADNPPLWIERKGWEYFHHAHREMTPQESMEKAEEVAVNLVRRFRASGKYPSKSSLEKGGYGDDKGVTRAELRAAIIRCIDNRKLVEVELPKEEKQGKRQAYLDIPPPPKCPKCDGSGCRWCTDDKPVVGDFQRKPVRRAS